MNTESSIILVKAFNEMMAKYNLGNSGINFIEVRNFETYIISQNIDIHQVNAFLALQK